MLKKYKDKITGYLEFIIVYYMIFGIMMNRHYSIDSYAYSHNSTTQYIGNLELGRIGNYLVFGLFKNINIITYQYYFTFLLIVVLAVSARMLYDHFKKNVKNEKCFLLLKIGILVIYGNVFMIDYFNYIEMVLAWCCGIMFMTLAVIRIKKEMSLVDIFAILIFSVISVSFYQALIGFFVCLALLDVYMLNDGKLTLVAFKNSIMILLCGGVAGIINISILRILQKVGIASVTDRTENIGMVAFISNVKSIFTEAIGIIVGKRGFLPRYLLLLVILILYTVIVVALLQKKAQWLDYVYIILLLICSRGVLYVPHLLASTVWMAPRSIISYWSILSIPCIIIVTIVEKDNFRNIATIAVAFIFLVNIINIQRICLNIIATNRIDKEIAYLIQNEIEHYEKESGNEIEKIVFKNDFYPKWTYESIEFQEFELCERIYVVPWGCVECINFFNNENYDYEIMDDEAYRRYFAKDNWDRLDLHEQLVFDGNVMYLVAY